MLTNERQKYLVAIAIVLTALIVAYGMLAYSTSAENRHRRIDGIVDQVTHYRNRLWAYHVDHGKPPDYLSDLGIPRRYRNTVHFSTQQGLPCVLKYHLDTDRHSRITKITCGNPVFAEFVIAEDEHIIKSVWHDRSWLYFSIRQHSKEPLLSVLLK